MQIHLYTYEYPPLPPGISCESAVAVIDSYQNTWAVRKLGPACLFSPCLSPLLECSPGEQVANVDIFLYGGVCGIWCLTQGGWQSLLYITAWHHSATLFSVNWLREGDSCTGKSALVGDVSVRSVLKVLNSWILWPGEVSCWDLVRLMYSPRVSAWWRPNMPGFMRGSVAHCLDLNFWHWHLSSVQDAL